MGIKVTKMQGCGNDFVIIDYDEFKKLNLDMPAAAKKLCDRNFGIGADGMIIPNLTTEDADIGWFFYNSDGTTAQMCGNGIRCFAKYIYDNKLVDKTKFSVKTLAGNIIPEILSDGLVKVNMSKPILESSKIPFLLNNNINYNISVKNKIFTGSAISMGNPHFVIFINDDSDLMTLAKTYGPEIEVSAEFPQKTNVEFVRIKSYKKIELCVWERGCGITLACGTGACASVVAGILTENLENRVEVLLPGGIVNIEWAGQNFKDSRGEFSYTDHDVYMSGPAEYVFRAEI